MRERGRKLKERRLLQKNTERSSPSKTDELMNDATSKLHDAISATAVNKQTVNVATMMLDTTKTKRDQAMQSLEKNRTKEKTD